ncbi:MAG: hypothetical protein LBU65_05015 [Planctomycetaceae bacterium]|nr:hypothetical protein [Planctomycetaceae bacterium]
MKKKSSDEHTLMLLHSTLRRSLSCILFDECIGESRMWEICKSGLKRGEEAMLHGMGLGRHGKEKSRN